MANDIPEYWIEVDPAKNPKGALQCRNGKVYKIDMKHPAFRKRVNESRKKNAPERQKVREEKKKKQLETITKKVENVEDRYYNNILSMLGMRDTKERQKALGETDFSKRMDKVRSLLSSVKDEAKKKGQKMTGKMAYLATRKQRLQEQLKNVDAELSGKVKPASEPTPEKA